MGMNDTDIYGEHYDEAKEYERLKLARRVNEYVRFAISWLMLAVAFVCLLIAIRAVSAQELCVEMGDVRWEGELIAPEWIGENEGWIGIPPNILTDSPMLILPAPNGGEYWLYSMGGGGLAVFPMLNTEANTDASGEHYGAHDFCDPFIWHP